MWPLLAGLAGAGISAYGQMQSANMMSNASQQGGMAQIMAALGAQQAISQGTQQANAMLQPYSTAGADALQDLLRYLEGNNAANAKIGGGGANLMSTFAPTMAQLESTPGYQWKLDQGLRAAQQSNAAKGMGRSGNAIAGAVDYAEGLASTTFQEQLQNYMAQNLQAYNMLMGPSQLGAGAAQTGAQVTMQGALGQAQALMGAGSAAGASAIGQASPWANAYQNIGNTFGGLLGSSPYMPAATAQNPLGFMSGFNPSAYLSGAAAQFGGNNRPTPGINSLY